MMKKRGLSKRILAFMLSFMMVIALVPMNAITVKAEGVPDCPHCGGTGFVCIRHQRAHSEQNYSNINSCTGPCNSVSASASVCGSHKAPLSFRCDYCNRGSACEHSSTTSYNDADFHGKTCKDCGEIIDKESHTYTDGKCSICGYACKHSLISSSVSYLANADYHWKKTCGVCGEIIDKESHTDTNNDGICDTCRYSSSNGAILPGNNNDEFKLNICNIPSEGGSTYCEKMPISYFRGTSATFTAKPNPGYRFKGWYAMKSSNASGELGTCLSLEETYTITPSDVDTYKTCDSGLSSKKTYSVYIAAVYEDSTVHTHSKGTPHAKVDATCNETGTLEYWECSGCDKNINDSLEEIGDITIPATGNHDFSDGACSYCGFKADTCEHCGGTGVVCYTHRFDCEDDNEEHCWYGACVGEIERECTTTNHMNGVLSYQCSYCKGSGRKSGNHEHTYSSYVYNERISNPSSGFYCHTSVCDFDGCDNTYIGYCDHIGGICSVCEHDSSLTHTHSKDETRHHEAKEASCIDGNIEYWECSCGKKIDSSLNEITDVTISATGIHDFSDGKCTVCNVKNIASSSLDIKATSTTYTGKEQNAVITGIEAKNYTVTGNKATNAGKYTVTLTGKGDYTGTREVEWTIMKATPTVVPPTSANPKYAGESVKLVNPGSTDFGKMLYSLDDDDYSEEIPCADKGGDYTVCYEVKGSDNWYYAAGSVEIQVPVRVDVTVVGDGSVRGYDLDEFYPVGTVLSLIAEPDEDYRFTGWDDDSDAPAEREWTVLADAKANELTVNFQQKTHDFVAIEGDSENHKCSVCGIQRTHDFFDGKCTVCNYECTHTGGTAICQEKKTCTLCGELYGDLVEHDFVNNGDGTHKCARCDERESHNYDGYYVEDTCHTKMCSACGMTNPRVYGKPYHTYGEWIDGMRSCICGKTEICTHNEETTGICSICHKDLDHIHTVDTYHEAKGASCVDGNIEYWDCTCGLKFDANDKVISDVTIPAIGPHDFSDEGICKICNYECTHQNAEGWTVEDGKCTSCGVEIGYPVDDDDKPVVVEKVPDQLWVTGIKQNLIYTGAKVEQPTMKVYWKNKLLVLNQDYTVKYLNNIKAGTATVVITGKGNYAGTIKETYPIEQIDIGSAKAFDEEITIAANGKAQKPTTTFTIEAGGKTVTLKNGTDYTYTYPVIKGEGEYEVTITGKGNYKGTKTVKVTVVDKGVAVTKLTVKKIPNQTYRDEDNDGKGDQIVPDVVVTYGKKTLEKGTDYTVEVAEGANTDIGVGTVTIVGNKDNGYYGKRNVTFNIVGTPVTKATVEGLAAETYTGSGIVPKGYKVYIKATKTTGQIDLTEDKDYKVSVDKNVNAGTATVTFTGINGYSGVLKKTFKINKASMTDERISIKPIDAAQYQKNGAKPVITVTDGSKVLKENVDYTVKYTNNNALHDLSNEVKKPTVTITGKGNYVGTKSANFAITGSSLSKDDITITATDIVASGKANTCKPVIKLTDNGVALKAGTDYETAVEYTYVNATKVKQIVNRVETEVEYAAGAKVNTADIIKAGTEIKATVKGKGFYADSKEVVFRYVAANIASAKVVIPNFVYTKKAITLDENRIQVTMVVNKKAETLKFGEDFEIIGYKSNVDKGTAKVTIRGLGNYGGTKEVAFKIVSKTLNHTVRLHNNDGSGKDVVKEVGITSGAMLPANTFKVAGKKFIGWNTKADGTGEAYIDREAMVRNYLSMLIFGDTLDLYAQWE